MNTSAEIQLPLKRFPDSSVSFLIPTGWCGRASHPGELSSCGRVKSCKVSPEVCTEARVRQSFYPGANALPYLSVEESDILKIKDDDDDVTCNVVLLTYLHQISSELSRIWNLIRKSTRSSCIFIRGTSAREPPSLSRATSLPHETWWS